MATVNKTIGTTARDYSTITLWEADDGGGDGLGNDDCTGTCYDDSDFGNGSADEAIVIDFSANSIVLTVDSASLHDGTANSAMRILITAQLTASVIDVNAQNTDIKWLEIDGAGNNNAGNNAIRHSTSLVTNQNLLIHDFVGTSSPRGLIHSLHNAAGGGSFVTNCIVYDFAHASRAGISGITYATSSSRVHEFYNNTVFNITGNHATEETRGISFVADSANHKASNNIVVDTVNSGAGADNDFGSGGSNTVWSHNLSSDASASGTGSLTSKTSANQFVSTTGGSEDLHLKVGADAIDAGTDLGTTPAGVEIDIDGRDRDAEADTWDMGADEFVAVGNNIPPLEAYYYRSRSLVN